MKKNDNKNKIKDIISFKNEKEKGKDNKKKEDEEEDEDEEEEEDDEEGYVPNIKRIKFSAPILPNSKVKLSLEHKVEKGSVGFTMADAENAEHVYSSGNFSVIPE